MNTQKKQHTPHLSTRGACNSNLKLEEIFISPYKSSLCCFKKNRFANYSRNFCKRIIIENKKNLPDYWLYKILYIYLRGNIYIMVTTTISDFRKSIKGYIDAVIENNEPVLINRGRQGAVLVSLGDYNAMVRTASVLMSGLGTSVLDAAKKQEFVEVDIDSL